MVPVGKRNYCALIIYVIQALMGILWVIYDKRSSKTVTILGGKMRVIPKSSSLVVRAKFVEEGAILRDWTLGNERCAICPVCFLLLDTMPML